MTSFTVKNLTGSAMRGFSIASFPTGCTLPTKWPDQPLYAGRKAAGMSGGELHIRDSRNVKHFSSGIPTPSGKQGLLILNESTETAFFVPLKRVYRMMATKTSTPKSEDKSATPSEPPKKKSSSGINLSQLNFGPKNNDDDDDAEKKRGTQRKDLDNADYDDFPDIGDYLANVGAYSRKRGTDEYDADDEENNDPFFKEKAEQFNKAVSRRIARAVRDKERTNEDDDLISQRINADDDEPDDCVDDNATDTARNVLGNMFQNGSGDKDSDDDEEDMKEWEEMKKSKDKKEKDKHDPEKNKSGDLKTETEKETEKDEKKAPKVADEDMLYGVSLNDIRQRVCYIMDINGGVLTFDDVRNKIQELTGVTIAKEKFPEIRKKLGLKKKGKNYFF